MATRVRRTSAEAYREIVADGTLPKARRRVFQFLYDNGPLTGTEIDFQMSYLSAHKRLSELRDSGLIEETGERKCSITGKNVVAWDVR